MIMDHETNCVYLAATLKQRYPDVWRRLVQTLQEGRIELHELEGTSEWVRDFLPVQVDRGSFVQFRYCPDYLRYGYEHLIPDPSIHRSIPQVCRCISSDIILDGGNVVPAGKKAILTEKVFRENPHYRQKDLRRKLQRLLHVEECIFIPEDPGDPVICHADGIVRFVEEDVVVINDYSTVNRRYGRRLTALLKQHGFMYEELPYFTEKAENDGIPSAVGCYVNYLKSGSLVIAPTFGAQQDEAAIKKLEHLFPSCTVTTLRCARLARQGGVLNCVSWTIQTGAPDRSIGPSIRRTFHRRQRQRQAFSHD